MKPKQPSKPAPQSPAERREQQRKDFSKRVEAEKRGRKP
jgi:hypothetical protein